jgi:hypothetical protein
VEENYRLMLIPADGVAMGKKQGHPKEAVKSKIQKQAVKGEVQGTSKPLSCAQTHPMALTEGGERRKKRYHWSSQILPRRLYTRSLSLYQILLKRLYTRSLSL